MMNIENINKLINHLKLTRAENFTMMHFMVGFPEKRKPAAVLEQMETVGGCGTIACLAGHAILIKAAEEDERLNSVGKIKEGYYGCDDVDDRASEWLGLTREQATDLFYEMNPDITPEDTIPVLEHLRDTGIVDWGLSRIRGQYE